MTETSAKPWIVAGVITALVAMIIVAVVIGVQHQRFRACEMQKVDEGNDAATAALICRNMP